MIPERIRKSYERFGWRKTSWQILHLSLARLGLARFLHVLWLDPSSQDPLAQRVLEDLEVRPLDEEELLRYAKDPRFEMNPVFIRQALDNGDVCLAVFLEGCLAGYAWYGRRNMELYRGLVVSTSDLVAYTYKVFTLPEFRGRHCLAANIEHALSRPVLPGTRRLVCLVEASNLVSFVAFSRLGFSHTGWLCVMGRSSWRRWRYLGGIQPEDRLTITSNRQA